MSWQFLAVLAAALWASVNVLDKFLVSKYVRNPLVMFSLTGFFAAFIMLGIYLRNGLHPISAHLALLGMLSGVLYTCASILYFNAIKEHDVSRMLPLFFTMPLFSAVFAGIFLGEIFLPKTYIGIAAIVAGALLLAPRIVGTRFKVHKAFWFVLGSACVVAIGSTVFKYVLDNTTYWTGLFYVNMGQLIAIPVIMVKALPDVAYTLRHYGKRVFVMLALVECIDFSASLVFWAAASAGYITLVNAFSSVQPFFVLLYAVVLGKFLPNILDEDINKHAVLLKFGAICLMFAGILLVG